MGFDISVLGRRRQMGAVAFSPASLFSAGEQGIWLEPSDLTTMFQDRAGTIPVTTPGQTVGLRLDKSKGLTLGSGLVANGTFEGNSSTGWTLNTWTVANDHLEKTSGDNLRASGTLLSALVSGRSYRVTLDASGFNAACTALFRTGVGGTASSGYSIPSGTATHSFVLQATDAHTVIQFFPSSTGFSGTIDNISVKELSGFHATAPTDAARPTYGIEPKTGRRNLLLATDTMATQSLTVAAVAHTLAFTGTGTITLTGASIAGPLIGTGASNRVSLTFTPTAASLTLTVSGSVTLAQLELGSVVTNYQRVGTAFDVTEAGVPTVHYVQYDGADDSFTTPTITPGINKVQVFAGVRKLSDAALASLLEHSTTTANNGSFGVYAPRSLGTNQQDFGVISKGTLSADLNTETAGFAAPFTAVLTATADISGDLATLRVNGTQAAQSTADQGTGNFLAYPLYIGRRGGTTLPFNGRDYGMIVRFGANLEASTITATETYLAARTSGVTL